MTLGLRQWRFQQWLFQQWLEKRALTLYSRVHVQESNVSCKSMVKFKILQTKNCTFICKLKLSATSEMSVSSDPL